MGYTIIIVKTYEKDARKVAKDFNALKSEDMVDAVMNALYSNALGEDTMFKKRVGGKGMDDVAKAANIDSGGMKAITLKQANAVGALFDAKFYLMGKSSKAKYPFILATF
jgi:hypothetical protein